MANPTLINAVHILGSAGSTFTISEPPSPVANDIIAIRFSIVAQSGENPPALTVPTGWNEDLGSSIDQTGPSPDHGLRTLWRRYGSSPGSDPGSWTFNLAAGSFLQAIRIQLRGCPTTGNVISDSQVARNTSQTSSVTAPAVNPTGTDDLLVFFGSTYGTTVVAPPPTGMTEQIESTNLYCATQALAASGSTGTRVWSPTSGSDWLTGALVSFMAAAAGGGGDTLVTPAAASMTLSSVNPTTVLGSVVITPTIRSTALSSINPTVVLGSQVVTPAPASTTLSSVAPAVVLGSLIVTPTPSLTTLSAVAPTVVLGSLIITPTIDSTTLSVLQPTVIAGSLIVTPTPSTVTLSTTGPVVETTGGAITPAPATISLAAIGPNTLLGSIVVSPAMAAMTMTTTGPIVDTGTEVPVRVIVLPSRGLDLHLSVRQTTIALPRE